MPTPEFNKSSTWRSFSSVKSINVSSAIDSKTVQSAEEAIEGAIAVEEVDVNLYRSLRLWIPAGARGVFGGQVIAQATLSAAKTVPENLKLHSLHSYFINAGDPNLPILYQVERIRDGRSYATRTVQAKQRDRIIFTITCSFHSGDQDQMYFQHPSIPNISTLPRPETLKPEEEKFEEWIKFVSEMVKNKKEKGENTTKEDRLLDLLEVKLEECVLGPVEIRDLGKLEGWEGNMSTGPEGRDKWRRMYWIRSRAPVKNDDATRKSLLAYASDLHLMGTISRALGVSFRTSKPRLTMMVSLDHSMWFHDNDSMDPREWMLYVMEASWADKGRGLAQGQIYDQKGRLLITVAQEGMIRVDSPKKPDSKL
eukprot:TRINITY_DN15108_c0_g1_i1.p1 TRINITY_DN15108_c0_g1~~TRINITY_DN15108_c0_g1_i1.p1  ORF type:complete len:367 (-),score=114.98 TRINITY_DN15108_c0_g1_i1:43-1143(-)